MLPLASEALGYTLGMLVTFLGIGVLVNVIIVYVVGLVLAERRANQRDRETGAA